MTIVSQDAAFLTNTDEVENIDIKRVEDEYAVEAKSIGVLGFYPTKERAQEVVNELCETYEEECISKAVFGVGGYKSKTYRLPKE